MAVQQNRKSRSRARMRRGAHAKIASPALTLNPVTGQLHRRHHIAADGSYRGKQYLMTPAVETEQDAE